MSKFGWCTAPEGAKPQHNSCIKTFKRSGKPALICDCDCHKKKKAPAKKKTVVKRKG